MTRLLRPYAAALLLLLVLGAGSAVIVGSLLKLDAIRSSLSLYADYLPGQPRPLSGCNDTWEWGMSYGFGFTCVVNARDEIQVYGNDNQIMGAFFVFVDVRVGDVVALLGKPVQVYRSRLRVYNYHGAAIFLYRPRGRTYFSRLRFLSLSMAMPT